MNDPQVVVFDLDGTLVRGDSVAALLRTQIRASGWRRLLVTPLLPLLPLMRWSWAVPYLSRMFALVAFGGMSEQAWRACISKRVNAMASSRSRWVIEPVLTRLRGHLKAGDRVLVVTGAYQHMAEAIVRDVLQVQGVIVLGSVVEWKQGMRLKLHCFGASKLLRLRQAGIEPPLSAAYSDSKHDLPLLRSAHRPYWVGGSSELAHRAASWFENLEWIPDHRHSHHG
ncbi:haloacid dehalogenase-like hydrolase [Pseudomarimonas arenosa]|uniref:Haloacid dehalogenase-like hydrolase n=1 Tax=Pseudomarimonas arenosa TaxID=2774145 RepID=A0AAW3ZFT3_9GAMM|nr:haloacid dehalogenase-like hydrolase [Pseudomarimonas arenosa]MBD8524953.1 haloacid dehalogenase-like hydrolase [Pseudomarimonas arenosa]